MAQSQNKFYNKHAIELLIQGQVFNAILAKYGNTTVNLQC